MTDPNNPSINQASGGFIPYKTIKLWKEVLILLVFTLGLFSIGIFIGNTYFWNQFDQTPLLDKQYQSAMEKVKQNPDSAANHVDFGWALFQKGQYNEALAEYKKATELDEKNFQAYLNLGIAYQQVDKIDIAITTLQKAIELAPKSYEAHYYLGLSYQRNGKLDQALEELFLADKLHPGSTKIIYDIGQLHEKMGSLEEAKKDYQDALNFDPQYTLAQEALSRLGGVK
ncbi:tetratricopeptide repeat protein [Desulfitobacterium sp.]|uniref:Photosystem I assembly protein Ycf3 n=1 Tax=bioreactor metagenome TaxID=1076179 RepID=A0A645CGW0_9ZZZZ|nr:tetratricopeptide repeat protein [Desulfitobacterium sp.]MEA4901132.1 tetratricopeptide repeat protein [Desulfitobacterium sp.]